MRRDIVKASNGYLWRLAPEHPNAMKSGYILDHRWVMSQHLGRPLAAGEVVHHKDGNRANNAFDNLELLTERTHKRHHWTQSSNPRWVGGIAPKTCVGCGQPFAKTWRANHGRDKFCTRACMTAHSVGASAPNAKLSDDDVAAIRALRGILSQRRIAARFGVSKTQVARILNGQSR
jgi:hypothetical protein